MPPITPTWYYDPKAQRYFDQSGNHAPTFKSAEGTWALDNQADGGEEAWRASQGLAAPATPMAPASNPPMMAPTPSPQRNAGDTASLLREKEQQGQQARASLTGLHEATAARGVGGSGIETQGTSNIAGEALKNLTAYNTGIQGKANQQGRDLQAQGYQGDLQQRSQDILARGQDLNASSTLAGQAAQAEQQRRQALLAALQSQVY